MKQREELLTALRIQATQPPTVSFSWIWNDLKALQGAVGGYIETVTLPENLVLIRNEEGKLKDPPLPPSGLMLYGDPVVGDVIITASDLEAGEFCSIPKALRCNDRPEDAIQALHHICELTGGHLAFAETEEKK